MIKVTNVSDNQRKFRDRKEGKDVYLEPNETIETNIQVEKKNGVFKVEDSTPVKQKKSSGFQKIKEAEKE